MNEEQNATIPDGSIILQILNRFWAAFQYYQKMSEPSLFLISRFLFVTVLIDGIERTRETVATLLVFVQISFVTLRSFSFFFFNKEV